MDMSKKLIVGPLAFLISAVIFSACGSLTGLSTSPTSNVPARSTTYSAVTPSVPWIDKPTTIPTTTVVTAPLPPTCKTAELKVGTATSGLATAQEGWSVPIINTENQPCSLADYLPDITAIGPSGNRVTLSNSWLMQPAPPVVLLPGIAITFQILSSAFCDSAGLVQPSEKYTSVELALPTGILDLANLNLKLCSNRIFSGFQEPVSIPPAPGTVASLSAHLEMPKTVKAGESLRYQVILENQSNKTVTLQPCPIYKEVITVFKGMKGKSSSLILELNCTTIHSIKPHQKITYQMVISVPSEPGPAKFGWHIAPGGPFVGTALTIAS